MIRRADSGGGAAQNAGGRAALGMGLMALAMQIVPFSDAAAKILTGAHGYSPAQTAWARIVFAAVFLAPAAAALRPFGPPRAFWRLLKPHLPRGACWAGATVFFFTALKNNSLAASLSLLFAAPLFVYAAAPFALGERFVFRRLPPLAAGLCGALVVLRPAADDFSPSLLWALAAGLCYGGYLMAVRRTGESGLGGGASALSTMCAAAVLVAPFALADWRNPEPAHLGLMALMGGLSAAGHFLIAKACEYADASQIAPFNYTEMGGALLAGWLIFGEFPDSAAFFGIVLIVGAGVVAALQDLRAGAV